MFDMLTLYLDHSGRCCHTHELIKHTMKPTTHELILSSMILLMNLFWPRLIIYLFTSFDLFSSSCLFLAYDIPTSRIAKTSTMTCSYESKRPFMAWIEHHMVDVICRMEMIMCKYISIWCTYYTTLLKRGCWEMAVDWGRNVFSI